MDELQRKPEEVKARLDGGEKLVLADVREHREYEVCRIEGAKHVPLGSLAARVPTLPDVEEVMPPRHAQSGRRGRAAGSRLRESGISCRWDRAVVRRWIPKFRVMETVE